MRWVLQMIETGMPSGVAGLDIMEINRPDGASTMADLGLTLSEAKQLLARVQHAIVAAQAGDVAARRSECPSCSDRCYVDGWRCDLLATRLARSRYNCRGFVASDAVTSSAVSLGHRIVDRRLSWIDFAPISPP